MSGRLPRLPFVLKLDNSSLVKKIEVVLLFRYTTFKFELLSQDTTIWTPGRPFPEYIIGKVSIKINKVLIAAVYRPPHSPFVVRTSFIQDLTSAMDGYNHKIIIGDFNADQLTNSVDYMFISNFVK